MNRRKTNEVFIKDITIGSGHPVAIQTMYSLPLHPLSEREWYEQLLFTLRSYATMGCDIIRFSYPSSDHFETFRAICNDSPLAVVADIHFDQKLAIEAIKAGSAKIRINPGNIGSKNKVREIVSCAKDHACAIRIGLNGGSLPVRRRNEDPVTVMVETALEYTDWFESWNFDQTVLSVKHTDVDYTYRSYKELAKQCSYPLHLGVTEAGSIVSAVTRSTWALGRLLSEGIGDTMRISISDDNMYEISAAKEILRTVGIEHKGIHLISCPKCGRSTFDSQSFVKKVEHKLLAYKSDLTVAIMGCQVNGPGEAAHADIAITGIGKRVFLYMKGKLVKEVLSDTAEEELMKAIGEMIDAQ
ncbi:MAG: flavodoxin-dependent (E)-4-hydroxy-3-methylbut-2-enyl-diphosphate synthase [Sphaerochaetaceae bacterium]|nr:flavodoxin-dependent (E)-4-hydroxy-3-methylbut-2-enyl-diphosphate synthase [Sphaerochaetaceae bacterium]